MTNIKHSSTWSDSIRKNISEPFLRWYEYKQVIILNKKYIKSKSQRTLSHDQHIEIEHYWTLNHLLKLIEGRRQTNRQKQHCYREESLQTNAWIAPSWETERKMQFEKLSIGWDLAIVGCLL